MELQIALAAVPLKTQISLSAEGFKKGQRVVVKTGYNEWYVGTVTRSVQNVSVAFDDGLKATIQPDDFKDVRLAAALTKKIKKALTTSEAKKYIEIAPPVKIVKVKPAPSAEKNAKAVDAFKRTDNVSLDRTLGATTALQMQLPMDKNYLLSYLYGNDVPDDWIKLASTRRTTHAVPDNLYRLCLVSKENSGIGKRVEMSKLLVSASDRKINAIYAGCSYHNNANTNMQGKQLVLVAIKNARCAFTLDELLEIMAKSGGTRNILTEEREYLISGPLKASIIEVVPNTMLTAGKYLKLSPQLKAA